MDANNPYAPPETEEPYGSRPHGDYQVVGDTLHVRDGTRLPDVCLRSGAEVGEFSLRRQKFAALSKWRLLGLVFLPVLNYFAILVVWLIGLSTRRKATIEYCLLQKFVRPPLWRKILYYLAILCLLAGTGGVVALGMDYLFPTDNAIGLVAGLFIVSAIIYFIASTTRWRLTTALSTDKKIIVLEKVSPRALAKLADLQENRQAGGTDFFSGAGRENF